MNEPVSPQQVQTSPMENEEVSSSEQAQPTDVKAANAGRGHQAVLNHLRNIEAEEPFARPQFVGKILFDMVCNMVAEEGRVRVEDVFAILASVGGFSCVFSALYGNHTTRIGETDIVAVTDVNGRLYYFGDLPNQYLLEDRYSLLSLVLGAAQGCGGNISMDMVYQTMKHVADTAGKEEFGKPVLPPDHLPVDLPFNFVRHIWPHISEALNLYEVPLEKQPAAIGFALQRAIEAFKDIIAPTLAAQLVIECSVPMAKINPEEIVQM
jgi:hypothetical protein